MKYVAVIFACLIACVLGIAFNENVEVKNHHIRPVPPLYVDPLTGNEMRRQHITFFTQDMQASLDFWENVLGYRAMMDVTVDGNIVGYPCTTFRDILLIRTPEDVLDIIQLSDCVSSFTQPSAGIHHIGYFVKNVTTFYDYLVENDIDVYFAPMYVGAFEITEACFSSPDGLMFCAAEWDISSAAARSMSLETRTVPYQTPSWLDALDFRYQHITFFPTDLRTTLGFWKDFMGYVPMMDWTINGAVVGFDCKFRDIMLSRGTQDDLDICYLYDCNAGVTPPPVGFHHIGYMVNNLDEFHSTIITKPGVTVLFAPLVALDVKEACYLSPDGIMFCAGQWV